MKNRKFIGDQLESCGWDIETYNSQLFEGKPMFWAEFSYTNGHQTYNWDLKQATELTEHLCKFIVEGTKKQLEFEEKYGKKKGKK